MRRDAESLLVLAGERSPRRWSQPVPIGDVLRSALGEVGDFRRVVLRHSDDVLLDGSAVTDHDHPSEHAGRPSSALLERIRDGLLRL